MPWESVIPNVLAGDADSLACHAPVAEMDNEAFAGFYERSARSLWAYLARVSCDPALADDLMQESYVRFLCASFSDDGEVAARRYLYSRSPRWRARSNPSKIGSKQAGSKLRHI